jgi:hypothetical protein
LGASEPASHWIERRKRLVARPDVPLAAVLLRLEVHGSEDVNEEKQRAKRCDLEFYRHVVTPRAQSARASFPQIAPPVKTL